MRLRYGYFITCTGVVKDSTGAVTEIHCTYDPATRGGNAPDGRKVKSTIHWVSAAHAVDAEVRLYDNLFTVENPNDAPEGQDFTANLNPNSLETVRAKLEPSLATAAPGSRYQFERLGYFCADLDSTPQKLVFNRTVTLRDTWAKIEKENEMIILGLGGIPKDPACAVFKDGALLAAVEENKVARNLKPSGLPGSSYGHRTAPGRHLRV